MKQGKPVINLVMIAMAVVLAVYFGFYVFNTFNQPYASTLTYNYTLYDSTQADGLLIREEQVLPAQNGIVDVVRSEGERIGVGQTVAMVYRDSQAQSDQAQLEAMDIEIALLSYSMKGNSDLESAARLDEDILQALVTLRGNAARNDYGNLEDQIVEVKSGVLKRGYTYGDDVTSTDLNAKLAGLKAQRNALNQQASYAITRVTASKSGIYSSYVDGMELTATPEAVMSMGPEQLRGLMDTPHEEDPAAVGKLITSNRWYFACIVPQEDAERMHLQSTVTVRFTGDFTQDVDMRVDQVSGPEGGKAVVILSSDRYLNQTTLLRQQSAELIFDQHTGLRLPKKAVHMIKYTETDEETGKEVEHSYLGVYVLVAGRTELKPVEVVAEGSDFYVLKPANEGRTALRAGDEVITRATNLSSDQLFKQ